MDLIKKNPKISSIISLALAVAAILILLAAILMAWKLATPKITIVKIGHQEIRAEIAATPLAIYRGLSARPALGADCGMLFNFSNRKEREFIMRNMKFPLDIIFIADKKIIKIAANLPPEGHNPTRIYQSGEPADQVLEVNGGYCEQKGISVGDRVFLIE